MVFRRLLVCASAILFSLSPGYPQSVPSPDIKPLPDLKSFLQDIRQHLHTDSTLQSQYTFTEKLIRRQMDSKGNVKNTESMVYEVYPPTDEYPVYRKTILINDIPPGDEQISKAEESHRERQKKWQDRQRQPAEESPNRKQRREAKEKEARQKEQETADELFNLFEIKMIGREQMEGISVIGLTFEPRRDYKPKTDDGKTMSKVHGTAWVSEDDKELVHLDVELKDNIKFGLGIIAKLNKGTHLTFKRRKLNDEIWLPAYSSIVGTGRILIFKGFQINQEAIYSDYRKFSVETEYQISLPEKNISQDIH